MLRQVTGEISFKETASDFRDRRVSLMQLYLKERGHYQSTIDGRFGPETTTAVQKYQRHKKLPENGVIDAATGGMMGMPFWTTDAKRTLDTPFRDEKLFQKDQEFRFQSSIGLGYFFSSWPDVVRDPKNCLTARALRTNNPGALNISKWQKDLNGYVGITKADGAGNKTTIYETPEDGIAAWGILLRIIYFKGKTDKVTIGQIVDRCRGSIPRKPYLEGYLRFSDGELVEDYEVDLYEPTTMKKVAVASFSHEFGSWYPLLDEQLLAGLAASEAYVSGRARQRDITSGGGNFPFVSESELHADFYRADPEEGDDSDVLDDGAEEFAEGIDREGSITSVIDKSIAANRAVQLQVSDAYWPANPRNAPDTWHVPGNSSDVDFELTYALTHRILEAGCFRPDTSTNGKYTLALRGCVIAGGASKEEDQPSIRFRATRPDHEAFLCSIGVVDTSKETLSFYMASTVPRRTGMLKYYNKINFEYPWSSRCNMLPSGCYQYCVGTHYGDSGKVTFVLRLGNGPEPKSAGEAVVLRTTNDLCYGVQDIWDRTKPADNIHPAALKVSFSSIGCLTLKGTQGAGSDYSSATGPWKSFRKKLGFENENLATRFDVVLVTGHEAAAIAAVGQSPIDPLLCLRQGSQGDMVAALQQHLGLTPDKSFGPATTEALVARQRQLLGFASGTYNREMAALLGFNW